MVASSLGLCYLKRIIQTQEIKREGHPCERWLSLQNVLTGGELKAVTVLDSKGTCDRGYSGGVITRSTGLFFESVFRVMRLEQEMNAIVLLNSYISLRKNKRQILNFSLFFFFFLVWKYTKNLTS